MPFFVVRQAVAASMDMGVGHAGLVKLCRFLDIKPLTHTSFTKHVHAICDANNSVVTRMLDEAANTVCRMYSDIDSSLEADDTIDLTDSCDGSWMTRGHKSQYGIGCVIEVMTGLVIDLQVMLYCQRCAYVSTPHGGVHTRGFIKWFKKHEPECNKNYEGSSGGMEMKAAELLHVGSFHQPALPLHHHALRRRRKDLQPSLQLAGVWRRGVAEGGMHQPRRQNDSALHRASWQHLGRRLASPSEVGASASSNRRQSTS